MRATTKDRRKLSVAGQGYFETDDAGDLFWKGRKIRTGGWTAANRIAFTAMIVAALGFLGGLASNYDKLGGLWTSFTATRSASGGKQAAPLSEQPPAPAAR
jgi:hypothetical protein